MKRLINLLLLFVLTLTCFESSMGTGFGKVCINPSEVVAIVEIKSGGGPSHTQLILRESGAVPVKSSIDEVLKKLEKVK